MSSINYTPPASGGTQDLQSVTDFGNVTTNDIILDDTANNQIIALSGNSQSMSIQNASGETNLLFNPAIVTYTVPSLPAPGIVSLEHELTPGAAGLFTASWRALSGVPAYLSDITNPTSVILSGASNPLDTTVNINYYLASIGSVLLLPQAITVTNKVFYIKNIATVAASLLRVTAFAGDTIDSAANTTLYPMTTATRRSGILIQSLGGFWIIISSANT